MEVSVKQRLNEFISREGISVRAFERACGLSNTYLRSLRHTPSDSKLSAILEAFPQIDRVWLLTGEGEMYRLRSAVLPERLARVRDLFTASSSSSSRSSTSPARVLSTPRAERPARASSRRCWRSPTTVPPSLRKSIEKLKMRLRAKIIAFLFGANQNKRYLCSIKLRIKQVKPIKKQES